MKPPSNQPSLFDDSTIESRPSPAPMPEPNLDAENPGEIAPADILDVTDEDVDLAAESPATGMDEAEELADRHDEAGNELAGWKAGLRYDFERWLASLDDIPQLPESDDTSPDAPDLYSFYEQLTAASAESRKANRRTAEAMSQWGETLTKFELSLQPLRETTAQLAASQPKDNQMSRAHCLMLVELLDRLHRLAQAFDTAPARKSWWGGNASAWRKAWESQRQGQGILVGHLQDWLKKEGVTRIPAIGQAFDPTLMMAVAAEVDANRPSQTIIEETMTGYLRHGELLRAAQVKVTRQP